MPHIFSDRKCIGGKATFSVSLNNHTGTTVEISRNNDQFKIEAYNLHLGYFYTHEEIINSIPHSIYHNTFLNEFSSELFEQISGQEIPQDIVQYLMGITLPALRKFSDKLL